MALWPGHTGRMDVIPSLRDYRSWIREGVIPKTGMKAEEPASLVLATAPIGSRSGACRRFVPLVACGMDLKICPPHAGDVPELLKLIRELARLKSSKHG